ncbi:MAG: hypothetical protein M3Z03_03575 [Actinomycetota bacterium]|nr:hypothetical protein [Actinomycetota bacterium]
MNFLAHVRVALASGDDERFVLGAVLPDLESLLGPLGLSQRDHPEVARGIAVHRATDAAFHADRRFVAGSIALTRALQAEGVGRGPSRAVGHAGWELLLDGTLVDDAEATGALAGALELLARSADGSNSHLTTFNARAEGLWAGYVDPYEVASRLHRQLADRPRLALPVDQVATVGEVLARTQPEVAGHGPAIIRDVTDAVLAGTAV